MDEELRQEQYLNNNLYWLLRHAFFGATIGDILRACRGGAHVGAFTLSMCAISAFGELEWCNQNQNFINADGTINASKKERPYEKDYFVLWLQRWLNGGRSNDQYDADSTYAIRCALVHSYGWSRALSNASLDGYLLCRREPQKHCHWESNGGRPVYWLNLENLIADVIIAADQCIWHLVPSSGDGFMNYVRALIAPKKFNIAGQPVVDTNLISLDFFERRLIESPLKLAKSDLIHKIQESYPS